MLDTRERVGVFNWLTGSTDDLEKSADTLLPDILKFIDDHLNKEPLSLQYPADKATAVFYDIMWVIYLADAIPLGKILEFVQRIHPDLSSSDLKRKLYTLRVAQWVNKVPFGGQDYYFLIQQADPFQYGFKAGVTDKEPARKALAVRTELFRDTPKGALARVRDERDKLA